MSAQVARKASCMNWLKNFQSNRPGRSGRRKPTGLNIPGETVLKMTTVHSETVAEKLPTGSRSSTYPSRYGKTSREDFYDER